MRNKLPSIRLSYYTTIFVTVCFSLIDSLKNLDMLPEGFTSNHDSFPALFTRACVACTRIMYFSAFHDIRENDFKIIKMPIMIYRHFLYQVRSFFHAFLGGKTLSHNYRNKHTPVATETFKRDRNRACHWNTNELIAVLTGKATHAFTFGSHH